MNVFETIKAAVSMWEAAEHYGLRVLPNGMACCPFHDDHHPSLKLNEDYFFCFGCNAHGDVIDFTARLWGLSAQEAVEKLRGDFGIETGQMPIPFPTFPEATPNLEQLCICVLKEYLRLLRIWRLRYAPVTLGCDPDDRFVESLQMEPVINFFLDSLIAGDSALRERVLQVFRKDGTIYELCDYVERKSKEDIAKQFYADAYKAAVSIVGGEQYILSAVMHADERNRAMSEKLGEDVYHYHLHVVYIPVVEKEVRWTKCCKDPALVGTVKERIHQVSMSKKWASQPAIGEDGQTLLTKSGKPVLKKSYSVLQDDFYNAMRSAGYTDLERGERGSSEEHLTVITQFKVEREQERLEGLTEQTAQKAQEATVLGKKIERYQKQEVAIQKVDAIEAKPVPLSSTKVILERKEYEALKATAKKYIAQEKREGVLQKALDAAKGLINELKAEIASLREELSYYRSPKFQMKLHKIEKENFDLRDKLRVYDLIIDRHDLGRFFGKNRSLEKLRSETRHER